MLTATLLTFGRFSADQELTAARASGISLLSLILPILLLSVVLSGLSAWVSMDLGPHARVAYKDILQEAMMRAGTEQLPAGRFIKDFRNYIFYIGENRGGQMRDIMVFVLGDNMEATATVMAPRGTLTPDLANQVIRVELQDARSVAVTKEGEYRTGSTGTWIMSLPIRRAAAEELEITDMTFRQLQRELGDIRGRMGAIRWAKDVAGEMEADEARDALAKMETEITTPLRVQMHRQVAFSFACIGFTLIGIPLGIRVHRRETNVGVAVGLVLVLVYYSFFILGQSLEMDPQYQPHLILWAPNFLFQLVGGVLLWRANRGV